MMMNMNLRYSISLLALMSFVFYGCEREINLEHLRPDPKLVLNCLALQGDTLAVELSRTWFYTEDIPDVYVSGADVELYVNDVFRERLTETKNEGGYPVDETIRYKSSSYLPATGDRIRIVASKEGFKTAEAVTEIPRPCAVSDCRLIQETVRDTSSWGDDYTYIYVSQTNKMQFTLRDEPGEENYYLLYLRQGNVYGGDEDTTYRWSSFFPDYGSEPLFAVQSSAFDQILGYDGVGGYNGLAFSDELFAGKSYQFNIPWNMSYSYTENVVNHPYRYRCYVYSISRSYYNYMKSLNDLYESGFTGDLAEIGFAEPIRIYSNVEGGTGILGGGYLYSQEFEGE